MSFTHSYRIVGIMKTQTLKLLLAALMLLTLGLSASPHTVLASGTSMTDLMALAENGNTMAQRTLGERFAMGVEGAPKDMSQAISWWQKAADNGDALSQFNLGMVYLRGAGAPQDKIQAHMWFSLAAAFSKETASGQQGNKLAETERSAVETKMTQGQIAEARARAQDWLAKHK